MLFFQNLKSTMLSFPGLGLTLGLRINSNRSFNMSYLFVAFTLLFLNGCTAHQIDKMLDKIPDNNGSVSNTVFTVVPNVKGLPLRSAINRLTAAKLSIDENISSKFIKTKRVDTVIMQTPIAGGKVKEGTAVKLVVSTQKLIWKVNPMILKHIKIPFRTRGDIPEE